jgi:hypothetical protein
VYGWLPSGIVVGLGRHNLVNLLFGESWLIVAHAAKTLLVDLQHGEEGFLRDFDATD